MIAVKQKQKTQFKKSASRHVSDLAAYILNATSKVSASDAEPEKEKVLCSGSIGFSFDEPHAQIAEMTALVGQCPRSKNPVEHFVLSWQSDEQPTTDQIKSAVEIFVKETGLENPLVIYGAHQNTDNIHVHIQICRINSQTEKIQKINNGYDKIMCQRAVARIEHAQGWKSEPNALYIIDRETGELKDRPRAAGAISLCNGARAAEVRTSTMSAERRAKLLVPELQKAENWQDFHKILLKNHAFCNLKTSGLVFRFTDNDTFIKCSRVNRAFSKMNLEKKFGPYEPLTPTPTKDLKMELQQPQQQQEPQQPQPEQPQQPQQQPEPASEPTPQPEPQEQPTPQKPEQEQEQEQTQPEQQQEQAKPQPQEQKQEQEQEQEQEQASCKNTLAAFIDKSAATGINALNDKELLSSLHSNFSGCATDKETMFKK